MSKRKHVTMSNIRKALNDSLFNPNVKNPLSIIADTQNPQYFVRRAMEMLNIVLMEQMTPLCDIEVVTDNLTDAISLLALAKVEHEKADSQKCQGA